MLTHKDLARLEHANACRPSRVTKEDVTALIQSADMAIRLREAAENVRRQFRAITQKQHELLVLGQTLESAAENWDEATNVSIDFEPLFKLLPKEAL